MNVSDYTSVPPGLYRVRIDEVRSTFNRNNNLRHALRLVVAKGEFTGRLAAWDAIVMSERGACRHRLIAAALDALPAPGLEDALPVHKYVGLEAMVEIRHEEHESPDGESIITRGAVPYAGWGKV